MSDDKFIHTPISFEVNADDIAAASCQGSIMEAARRHFIDDAITTMREHEEKTALDGMTFDPGLGFFHGQDHKPPASDRTVLKHALAMMEATAGGFPIGDRERVMKMPGDGEPAYMVIKEPDRIEIGLSVKWDMPESDPIDFVIGRRCGGFAVRPPMRIVTVVSLPMPQAPGVAAMLADGWVWTGWRFARNQVTTLEWVSAVIVEFEGDEWAFGGPVFVRTGPEGDPRIGQYRSDDDDGNAVEVEGMLLQDTVGIGSVCRARIGRKSLRAPDRYAGHINDCPVLAGRYADRLPTNRRRKRERAKARRRERTIR